MALPPGMSLHNYSIRDLLRCQCQMVARTSSDVDSAVKNAVRIQAEDTASNSSSSRPTF